MPYRKRSIDFMQSQTILKENAQRLITDVQKYLKIIFHSSIPHTLGKNNIDIINA